MRPIRHGTRRRPTAVAAAALTTGLVTSLSACAGWGAVGQGGGDDAINVLMVNNPQMVDLQQLTADNFTAQTGIRVNFTVLPENDVRDKISQEFSSQAGQYDVASLSNFEIPIYAKAKWISPLDGFIAKDTAFDQADILEPMKVSLSSEGKVYGQPFYGESSFLMYRKDVLAAKGLTMPANPTWPRGRRHRGQGRRRRARHGGHLPARPARVGPALRPADDGRQHLRRHVVREGLDAQGQRRRVQGGDQLLRQPRARVRRERRSPGGLHRVPQQPVPGQRRRCGTTPPRPPARSRPRTPRSGARSATPPHPVVKTKSSGWLYAWSWSIQAASTKQENAWKFISWASGKDYEQLVGDELGWSRVPAGKRASTYDNPDYLAEAGAFAAPTKAAIESADPANPGVQPRPALGIQFVDIPEFPDLGTQVSQDVSSAIAGKTTVDEALDKGQKLAEDVAERYQSREEQ